MPTVEGAGVPLHYEEEGGGPAVLLVHGMAADGASWSEEVVALRDGARVVAYDRRGYGASGAPEPYERTTVAEQAEDAAALLRALDLGPAVLAGRDLGALVVLDLVLRHGDLVRGAALVDPPALQLVADGAEALSAERAVLEAGLRGGGPAGAVRAWLRLRGAPERSGVRPGAFFADFGAQATLPLMRRELRAIGVPVAVLDGPYPPPHVRAASDALAALIPGARRGSEPVAAAVRALLAG